METSYFNLIVTIGLTGEQEERRERITFPSATKTFLFQQMPAYIVFWPANSRDVMEPASHVQNPSDTDADLSCDQNYWHVPAITATAIQLSYFKLNSYKQISSE